MRLTLTVVDPLGGSRADVVLDADPESPVGAVAKELAQRVGGGGAQVIQLGGERVRGGAPQLFVGGYPLDPEQTVLESALREGCVVSLHDPAGCAPGEPTGVAELRVAGGPAAGTVHRLGLGRTEIGRGATSRVRIEDPEMADRAATLTIGADGRCVLTVHGEGDVRKAARLDGEQVEGDTAWPGGAQLTLGNSLIELAPYTPPNAALRVSEDGEGFDYNRPPRLLPPDRETTFRLPSRPTEGQARPLPWLMALLPLVTAVVMAIALDRMYFLFMAVASPIMLFANYFMDKRHGRKSYAEQLREYEEHKARIEKDARSALAAERQARRFGAPDPGTILNTATGPRTRLWERRRTDGDHLLIRVGTCSLPSDVVLDDPEQDDHRRKVTWDVTDAPVTIPLAERGVVGVAGMGDTARALGRWLLAQTAVLHSPLDVQFYILTDASGQEAWDWTRWLPHARPTLEQDANCLLGTDAETVAARFAELTAILDARQKAMKEHNARGAIFQEPDLVIVLDGSRRLRSLPGVVRLLREGPAARMFAVCLDAEERFLPGECQAVVVVEPKPENKPEPVTPAAEESTSRRGRRGRRESEAAPLSDSVTPAVSGFPSFAPWNPHPVQAAHGQADAAPREDLVRLRVQQTGADRVRGVRPDFVTAAWCALVSRSLSAIRDISGAADDASIPNASRLLDVLELEPPTGEAVAARWHLGGQSTRAVIGESYDGAFSIDMSKDGPHGLIAGTTGSGKSELLQTIVAALAVANTPENMTFVLVDYKGGSAFKDCVKLPHTVGMVTDLDAHLVERALESLGAELTRREHILADAEAKDIEDFQGLLRREPGRFAPMPRLLIVIDEFASMVRDLPDFVTGLVNIAQRGRSLGIHLLLATQRPSGVVSPEIRANTNLRIALRVTDGGESSDVIDAPDAGHIAKSTPGRAYVRLGHSSLVPFQSGRVGGRRPGAQDTQLPPPWSAQLGWTELGRALLTRPAGAKQQEDEITDLKVLVDAVNEANDRLGIPAQHSPWLPALPESILLDEVPAPAPLGALPAAPYGIEDLPAKQDRRPLAVDFANFGHLMVGGSPRSGRSQLLRTIAASLARTHSITDVHLYGIDCGNGALNALAKLPHCGAVVGRNQTERAVRLIKRLKQELSRRQNLLAADGYADIGEQRAAVAEADRLPHIVVLLDRWEGWTASLDDVDNGGLTDELMTILREGASVGVHAILTGDRSLLMGRISTLTEDKWSLRLSDRTDYSLIGLNSRKVPDQLVPGRMLRSETGTDAQIALLDADVSGQAQSAAIAAIGAAATEREQDVPRSRRPFRVDVLPAQLRFDDAWEMRDVQSTSSPLWGLVGVGGDELTAFGPDLAEGTAAFIIGGPAKSGRSTVLLNFARSYLRHGTRLVVAAPQASPLRELAGEEGVLRVFTDDDIDEDEFADLIGTSSVSDPIAVLVDDAELLDRCGAKDELKTLVRRGAEHGRALVMAGDEEEMCSGFSGWQVEAQKARRGILLSPQSTSGADLVGTRLSRSLIGGQVEPGKGLLHLGDGVLMAVTTPMP
ncbi:cell division protein FtsK [Streptomyces sp. JJ66]|uniref:FtsK/SpoIIIE domain-containing protein n=1 Tax=Streptomyces sp. JJ66 TaxID=2803843 RepID=UPI001C5A2921|nr:FtsK/SpoIIIE domain-containing protein [Streptomyces sp. JJ66]MBW1601189.1 cell division protein FtsK [Streptomyces sp. JJ66]